MVSQQYLECICIYMWTCADRSTLSLIHSPFYIRFLHPLFLILLQDRSTTLPARSCASWRETTSFANAGMADVDEGGFPVETRAKPKILQVDGRPSPACFAVRVILCDHATGSSEHSGPDTIPAGQDGHVDDDDHRERPEGAKGDQ